MLPLIVIVSLYWDTETNSLLHFMDLNFHDPSMESEEIPLSFRLVPSLGEEDPPQAVEARNSDSNKYRIVYSFHLMGVPICWKMSDILGFT